MASGKRQPSKQKRTNQNRQERAARQARAAAASAAASSPTSSTPASGASPARGSLLGRLRGATSSTSPAPRSAAVSGAAGSAAPGRRAPGAQPVGYRAALTALLAAIAAVVASFFIHQPVDARGDIYTKPSIVAEWATTALGQAQAAPTAAAPAIVDAIGDDWMPHRSTERMFVAYLPLSLAAVLPVIGAYLLFRSVQQRRGSRVVNRAMYATLLGAFLSLPLLQFFLPTVIAGWVAGFQVRRADRAELLAAQAEAGDVIDAESVEGNAVEGEVTDAEVVDDTEVDDAQVVEAEVIDDADGRRS